MNVMPDTFYCKSVKNNKNNKNMKKITCYILQISRPKQYLTNKVTF